MRIASVTALAVFAVLISCGSALDCFECDGKGEGNDCAKDGEDFVSEVMTMTNCSEPTEKQEGFRAVCFKDVTTYESHSGRGAVSHRYCDIVDHKDSCWEVFGGATVTTRCVCSDQDFCNGAIATSVVSMVTLVVSFVAGSRFL